MASTRAPEIACRFCTFLNTPDANVCEMCGYDLEENADEVIYISDSSRVPTASAVASSNEKEDEVDEVMRVWEGPKVARASGTMVESKEEEKVAWEEQKMPARGRASRRESSSSSESLSSSGSVDIPDFDTLAGRIHFQGFPPSGYVSPFQGDSLFSHAMPHQHSGIPFNTAPSRTPSLNYYGYPQMLQGPSRHFNMPPMMPLPPMPQPPTPQPLMPVPPMPPPPIYFPPMVTPPYPASKKRKRPPSPVAPPKPPPMRAGSTKSALSFRDTLDVVRPDLTAPQRTELLFSTLDVKPSTAERWRVDYERKSSSPQTLWMMVVACAKDLHKTALRENAEQQRPYFCSVEEWEIWMTNLNSFFGKKDFQARLNGIQPAADDTNTSERLDCPICCESYLFEHFVFCEGDAMHPLCRRCFERYSTETIQAGSISQIPCADPSCKGMFATKTAQDNISKWDQLRMADREEERNKKVALAAKAVLKCICGAIGIVTAEDVGNGCILCPGCDKSYCVKCGNEWHEGKVCPPPAETVKWLSKKTRACPNCHTPIEKNGGCNHMHCRPPEGCGYHFNWSEAVAPEDSTL